MSTPPAPETPVDVLRSVLQQLIDRTSSAPVTSSDVWSMAQRDAYEFAQQIVRTEIGLAEQTAPQDTADDVAADAATLRGYISTYGETPAMTASHRDYWVARAEAAEAQLRLRSHLISRYQRSEALATPAPPQETMIDTERIAQLIAHRGVGGCEHDPANGKLHGCCAVCLVPWPCAYAGSPPATPAPPCDREAELRAVLRELVDAGDFSVESTNDVAIMLRLGRATDAARDILSRRPSQETS